MAVPLELGDWNSSILIYRTVIFAENGGMQELFIGLIISSRASSVSSQGHP